MSLLTYLCSTAHAQVANPSQAGKLSIQYGVTARDQPRNPAAGKPSQKGTLTFNYYYTDRLSFGMDLDTFLSKRKKDDSRVTGYGNTLLNFGYDALKEGKRKPAVSFTYSVKLPTADAAKGLGTGRTDHQIMGSLTRSKLGLTQRTTLFANLGFNFAGLPAPETDRAKIGVMVLRLDRILDDPAATFKRYTFRSELNATSRGKQTPSEIFANNSLHIKFNDHYSFRATFRTGITSNSSRVGAVGTLIYTTNILH
jgi:hypothetical protein